MSFSNQLIPFMSLALTLGLSFPTFAEDAAKEAKTVETVEVKASDLTLAIPKTWKQQQPSNNLRLAQFVVPAAKEGGEPAELVISGPFGGSAAQNIQRWIGQFRQEGRQIKMTQGESKHGKYILVDLTGTYNRSIGPPFQRKSEAVENYRVINVMLAAPEGRTGSYFLKLTGEKATVEAAEEQIRAVFGANMKDEKPYEL
ncbi:hypothetical protein [Thalassoglobus polymorphus]|uniref:PsbP C-terminal domain-containing protein n=1 Tax=Thalassoglobus polymorphus TaxID=2527994 RepID=A0A517QJQ0_9PLAN|nr:hypothetical protein [Thalassoglobus polymorphus]QDT31870.1 hypothetical protein Mal48_11060 [Thalassoglobus polymorphus]